MARRRPPLVRCVCCRQRVLPYHGDYVICGVCGWSDDGSQPDEPSSANHGLTLTQARAEYAREQARRRTDEDG